MPIHTTEAVVLRTIEYSETSLIVWLYTQSLGRVHVIAKGARRARSTFEGALEPLVRGELVFYRKAKADTLDIAKEFDPKDYHRGLRCDLPRLYRGVYLAELMNELGEDDVPNPSAWEAFCGGLQAMVRAKPAELSTLLFRAELGLLESAGLHPALSQCAACGGPPEPSYPLSIEAGGVLCAEHARRDPSARKTSVGAVKTLAAIAAGELVQSGREIDGAIRDLLDRFIRHHLGKSLRTSSYLRRRARPRARIPAGGPA